MLNFQALKYFPSYLRETLLSLSILENKIQFEEDFRCNFKPYDLKLLLELFWNSAPVQNVTLQPLHNSSPPIYKPVLSTKSIN